jgi:hypothetical protein
MFKRSAILLLLFCLTAVLTSAAQSNRKDGRKPPSRLHINSGTLYTARGVPILLHGVDALIAPGGEAGKGSNMDGKLVLIDRGSVGLTYDALTRLLNQKLQGGKVSDLKITSDKGKVSISGKVHKGIDIPFQVKGPVSVTSDGKLDLHASTEKAAKLPIGGIADALGLNMQSIVGSNKKGVKGQGKDIVFDPDELWGLPVHSHITGARVEAKELVLIIQQPSHVPKKLARAMPPAANSRR